MALLRQSRFAESMISRRPFFLMILFCCFFSVLAESRAAENAVFATVQEPARKLFVGEKLVYQIRYLGIPVGRAEAQIKEIQQIRGRSAYHIVVKVRSYFIIDLIYKVRDEHHSFIDVEKLYSLGYEKDIREGPHRMKTLIVYDQTNHRAISLDEKGNKKKEASVPDNVQDEVSCGYWFRTLSLKPKSLITIPVYADDKSWNMEVKLYDTVRLRIPKLGEFEALEVEPLMEFQGIFVKRGRIRGWISLDDRRIPLKMKVKIPVLGNVVSELVEYSPARLTQGTH